MSRSISIRIEILILILLIVVLSFISEFPFNKICTSISTISSSQSSPSQQQQRQECPPSPTSTSLSKQQVQQEDDNKKSATSCECCNQCPQSTTSSSSETNSPEEEEPTTTTIAPKNNQNQLKQRYFPASIGSQNLLSIFESEKEAFSFLHSPSAQETAPSSMEKLRSEAIEELKSYFHPSLLEDAGDKFLQLLIQISEFSAQDHRKYSQVTRALKKITTLSRMNFIKEASNFGSSALSEKKKEEDSNEETPTADDKNKKSNSSPPRNIQLFRFHQSSALEDDNALTVPSIPTNLKNLEIVAPTNFGLVAGFSRPLSSSKNNNNNVKVATVLTGHMRSYKRCAERLTQMVLKPSNSDLFIATYQDRGEKRFGKREQVSNDDVMDWHEVEKSYSPHLKGLFVGEVPLLRRRLEIAFPNAFTNRQFSWMLYQFLLIEIGLNLTDAAWQGWDFSSDVVGEMAFMSTSSSSSSSSSNDNNRHINTMLKSSSASLVGELLASASSSHHKNDLFTSGVWPWAHFWRSCGNVMSSEKAKQIAECSLIRILQQQQEQQLQQQPYDIFIRLRPDLFVVGTIKLSGINLKLGKQQQDGEEESVTTTTMINSGDANGIAPASDFQLSLDCGEEAGTVRNYGNRNFLADFNDNVILVTPHHPVYEWILDKVSDLSQVATYSGAKKFMPMFSYLAQLTLPQQDSVFVPLCTAERLWNSRAKQLRMNQNKTFGWFAMLRNASTFKMGKNEGANSERRRQLIRKIFAITNPSDILCPLEGGVMETMPPATKKDKKKKKNS